MTPRRRRTGGPAALVVATATAVVSLALVSPPRAGGGWATTSAAAAVSARQPRSGWIRQPANTWSNLAFVVAGLAVAWYATDRVRLGRHPRRPPRARDGIRRARRAARSRKHGDARDADRSRRTPRPVEHVTSCRGSPSPTRSCADAACPDAPGRVFILAVAAGMARTYAAAACPCWDTPATRRLRRRAGDGHRPSRSRSSALPRQDLRFGVASIGRARRGVRDLDDRAKEYGPGADPTPSCNSTRRGTLGAVRPTCCSGTTRRSGRWPRRRLPSTPLPGWGVRRGQRRPQPLRVRGRGQGAASEDRALGDWDVLGLDLTGDVAVPPVDAGDEVERRSRDRGADDRCEPEHPQLAGAPSPLKNATPVERAGLTEGSRSGWRRGG